MASRCYFVRAGDGGQYQWWNRRSRGRWVCDMWMNLEDGVVRYSTPSREHESSVPESYFAEEQGGPRDGARVVIEVGVPLFDHLADHDVIWVYYPTERLEKGWRCDLMTFRGGEVTDCRAGLCFSDRFLSSLCEEPPK